MYISETAETQISHNGLWQTLGMEFVSTDDPDTCIARMKTDERHSQHIGYVNGGATIALAETIAGVGSISLCSDRVCVGFNISCTHLRPAKIGTTLVATASIVHKGGHLHTWRVDVKDENGAMISVITVTNYLK